MSATDGTARPLTTRQILWVHTQFGRVAYQVDTRILREAMVRAGKRQVDIARGTHLSKSMVGDVVHGRRQPSEKALMAIAQVLDIADPRVLLCRITTTTPKETTAA